MSGREWEALLDAARRLLPSSLTMAEFAHVPDDARLDITTSWGAIRQLARAVRAADAALLPQAHDDQRDDGSGPDQKHRRQR